MTRLYRSFRKRSSCAARLARALGGSWFGRARLFVQVLTLPRNGRSLRRLSCSFGGRAFTVHCHAFRELAPFVEVFAAGDYEGDWRQCRTILDVGANIGAASLYFWSQAPGSRIVAVEPDQVNLERLRPNLAQIPGAEIVQNAVAGRRGRLTFYRKHGFNIGASVMEKRPGFIEDQVDAVTLDDVLSGARLEQVDLCKFDIEGAEFEMFQGLQDTRRIRRFIGEYHEDLARRPIADFLRLFPHHRTEVIAIAPQRFVCRGMLNEAVAAA